MYSQYLDELTQNYSITKLVLYADDNNQFAILTYSNHLWITSTYYL